MHLHHHPLTSTSSTVRSSDPTAETSSHTTSFLRASNPPNHLKRILNIHFSTSLYKWDAPISPSCPSSPNLNQSSDLVAASKVGRASVAACPEYCCRKMSKFEVDFDVHFGPAASTETIRVSGGEGDQHHESGFEVDYTAVVLCLAVLLFIAFLCLMVWLCVKMEQESRRFDRILQRIQAREVLINAGPLADPMDDHPIWYSLGLDQSMIDTIRVVDYQKDAGLVEGRECVICLSEFEEGESLRIMPRCEHAFHVRCVDRWLRTHRNCPMCRAALPDMMLNGVPVVKAEALQEAIRRCQQMRRERARRENGIVEMVTADANVNPNPDPHSDSSVSENGSNGGSTAGINSSVSAHAIALKIDGAAPGIRFRVGPDASPGSKKPTGSGSASKSSSPEHEQARASRKAMKASATCGSRPSSAGSGKGPTSA